MKKSAGAAGAEVDVGDGCGDGGRSTGRDVRGDAGRWREKQEGRWETSSNTAIFARSERSGGLL